MSKRKSGFCLFEKMAKTSSDFLRLEIGGVQEDTTMKAAVRCNALNLKKLIQQELHGKRLDKSSQRRRVRNVGPIVLDAKNGGKNLEERLAAHINGANRNAAAKTDSANVALHFIIRFPPEVLLDNGPTPFAVLPVELRKKRIMLQAINFINETHGGNAVFAARLDRDEAGETIVDVFAAPRYAKETKKGVSDWVSLTKFGKDLAKKHQAEIVRRSPEQTQEGRLITSPRAIGMSLQAEFATFFERENGVALTARTLKEKPGPDRLGIEEWKAAKDAMDAEEALARQRAAAIITDANIRAAEIEADAEEIRAGLLERLTGLDSLGERLRGLYNSLRSVLPDIRRTIWARDSSPQQITDAKTSRKAVVPKLAYVRSVIDTAKTQAEALISPAQEPPQEASGPDRINGLDTNNEEDRIKI